MRQALPIVLSLTTALTAAEEDIRPKSLPNVSLLPHGSQLKGVMIPRHDEDHRLVGSLHAGVITLVDQEQIAGENVVIDFFNDNGTPQARINLDHATFNQSRGIISSTDPVAIDSESFHVRGSGMHYAFEKGDGLITGPATTWFNLSDPTTMNASSAVIGATGLALLTQSVAIADPAANASAPAVVDVVRDTGAKEAQADAARQLETDKKAATAVSKQVDGFLDQANLGKQQSSTAEPKPLEVEIGEQDTVVSCDGGMYFDAEKGLLVYMKNITVKDPRFSLSGANEVQITLGKDEKKDNDDKKKEKDKEKEKKKGKQAAGVSSFNEVEKVVATGAVHIIQRGTKDKVPVEASGAIFTYRPQTGEITLSGGYPWVKQGNNFMRAKQPDLILRIKQDGSFVTEGSWEMGGTLNND